MITVNTRAYITSLTSTGERMHYEFFYTIKHLKTYINIANSHFCFYTKSTQLIKSFLSKVVRYHE